MTVLITKQGQEMLEKLTLAYINRSEIEIGLLSSIYPFVQIIENIDPITVKLPPGSYRKIKGGGIKLKKNNLIRFTYTSNIAIRCVGMFYKVNGRILFVEDRRPFPVYLNVVGQRIEGLHSFFKDICNNPIYHRGIGAWMKEYMRQDGMP